jgi:hypothetical protein
MAAWALSPAVSFALLIGAVYLDTSAPWRRRLAMDLEETEASLTPP